MTPEAEDALRGSIAAWEHKLVLAKTGREKEIIVGTTVCPLCMLYWRNEGQDCERCPVYERTGQRLCDGTPYEGAVDAFFELRANQAAVLHGDLLAEMVEAIEAEIAFLKSLLPAQGDGQQ